VICKAFSKWILDNFFRVFSKTRKVSCPTRVNTLGTFARVTSEIRSWMRRSRSRTNRSKALTTARSSCCTVFVRKRRTQLACSTSSVCSATFARSSSWWRRRDARWFRWATQPKLTRYELILFFSKFWTQTLLIKYNLKEERKIKNKFDKTILWCYILGDHSSKQRLRFREVPEDWNFEARICRIRNAVSVARRKPELRRFSGIDQLQVQQKPGLGWKQPDVSSVQKSLFLRSSQRLDRGRRRIVSDRKRRSETSSNLFRIGDRDSSQHRVRDHRHGLANHRLVQQLPVFNARNPRAILRQILVRRIGVTIVTIKKQFTNNSSH